MYILRTNIVGYFLPVLSKQQTPDTNTSDSIIPTGPYQIHYILSDLTLVFGLGAPTPRTYGLYGYP